MADRIARMWNGSSWEVITSTAAAPTAVVNYQSTAPSSPVTGQVWINDGTKVVSVWSGSAWIPTSISASDITTGTLAVTRGGTGVTTSTGLGGSVVLSESPTFAGTVTIPTLDVTTKLIAEETMTIALSDEETAITTGTAKITFRAPFAMTLTQIPRASLTTASTSGLVTVDINEGGTSVLGANKLSIDANEKTSTTAATATTLADTSIADDAEITFDIDAAGTGAKGLKITLYYKRS